MSAPGYSPHSYLNTSLMRSHSRLRRTDLMASSLHHISERWRLGLVLVLITAFFWATLPIALKIVLDALDPLTVTWFRFVVAAICTAIWLWLRGQLGGYSRLGRRGIWMLGVAAVMLIGNYVFYLLGVQYTSPANVQLLIQLAPLLMTLGGIWLFRERFSVSQWLGLAVLIIGMALFFRDQLALAGPSTSTLDGGANTYVMGSLLVAVSAVVWAIYALLQKQLLTRLGSMQILLVIYVVASIVLLPFSQPSTILTLDGFHWGMLLFCAFNTVGAYGAFAEALAHWEASRVSAVLATTPLLCILATMAVHALYPHWLAAERMTMLGWAGAGLVVLGSTAISLLGRHKQVGT